MARSIRIEYPGALYHVTSRGNERRPIFHDDEDRNAFLRFLGEAATRFGWNVSAWVLMTNHFHLVIQTPNADLSRGMHWINGSYAGWFNRRHERWGHFFGGRFKAFVIEKESYFKEVIRYVVLNPVRAKIVARPEEYVWSSYRATAGLDSTPSWFDAEAALVPFAEDRSVAETFYREFVDQKVDAPDCLWQKLVNGIYLGTEEWTKKVRRVLEKKRRSTEHPKKQRAVGRPAMKDIVRAVARVDATKNSDFGPDHRRKLRRLIAWLGWNECVLRLPRHRLECRTARPRLRVGSDPTLQAGTGGRSETCRFRGIRAPADGVVDSTDVSS